MIRKIRSYLVFTAIGTRILVFGVIPLGAIAATLYMATVMGDGLTMLEPLILCSIYCGGEIMADLWTFGGILSPKGGLPEYCKTSCRGLSFLTDAIKINAGRQFATELLLLVLLRGILCVSGGEQFLLPEFWFMGGYLLLMSFFFLQLGILVSRFFGMLYAQTCVALVSILLMEMLSMIFLSAAGNVIALGTAMVLAIVATVVGVWMVKRKGARGYYDE